MSRVAGGRRTPWLFLEFRRVLVEDGWTLLSGIPSVLAGAAALALALHLWTTPEEQVISGYLTQASLRVQAKDYDTALVCYERLIQDSGPQPDILYEQALALEAKGEKAQAAAILNQIAPLDRPGYLPAHLGLARVLLASNDRTERTLKAIEQHVRYALEGPESVEANAFLGQILIATGRPEDAEAYLVRAVDEHPELLLLLARLAEQQKQPQKAQQRAERARSVFQARAEAQVDDVNARLNWAAACVLLENYRPAQGPGDVRNYSVAVGVLEKGLKLSADPRYHQALARVYTLWADAVGQDPKAELGPRLALLERGLKHDPSHIELLDRLGAVLRKGGPEGDQVRSTLQALIADGAGTPGAHFILGVAANQQGRDDEARLHWEQAFRLDPGMGVVANNLAWLLAHQDPPDLDRALELVNLALEKQPKKAAFLGTRGIVLMKMERWSEALTDLEAELAENPKSEKLHRALAEVYDHLGSAGLASQHRSRAEALTKAAAPGKAAGQGG